MKVWDASLKNESFQHRRAIYCRPTCKEVKFSYSWCSKCPPCSRTHDSRRGRHCLMARSMITWSKCCHSSIRRALRWPTSLCRFHRSSSTVSSKTTDTSFCLEILSETFSLHNPFLFAILLLEFYLLLKTPFFWIVYTKTIDVIDDVDNSVWVSRLSAHVGNFQFYHLLLNINFLCLCLINISEILQICYKMV